MYPEEGWSAEGIIETLERKSRKQRKTIMSIDGQQATSIRSLVANSPRILEKPASLVEVNSQVLVVVLSGSSHPR